VDIVDEATGVSARRLITKFDGTFVAGLLPPGTYRAEVSASGFKLSKISGLRVLINDTARVDIRLELGEVNEAVTVEGGAVVLNTESTPSGRGKGNGFASCRSSGLHSFPDSVRGIAAPERQRPIGPQ
jgi:hypothetical protein